MKDFRSLLLPLAGIFALLIWASSNTLVLKKTLALLMLPAGLIWLALTVIACRPRRTARWRLCFGSIWLLYTVAGSPLVGDTLVRSLEVSYRELPAPHSVPLDAVLVLGGGTSRAPDGSAHLGPAGDRVYIAAKLYLEGRCRFLVASGRSIDESGTPRNLAAETAAIWQSLGVPQASIIELDGPRNTREEVEAYGTLLAGRDWERVGLCTSAWHLPRALKLCRSAELSVIPVPADYMGRRLPWSPQYVVPQSRGFRSVEKALWEYLGMLVRA